MQGPSDSGPGGTAAARDTRVDAPGRAGPGRVLPRLLSELFAAAGMLLFRFAADLILFPDGEMFSVLRGRLYSLVFGWGHGVSVDRHVVLRNIRTIRVGRYTGIRRGAFLRGPVTIGEQCWIGYGTLIYPETTIGDHVAIAANVMLVTPWHVIGPPGMRAGPASVRPIRIGSGAIINGMAMILGGCDVGEGAVVMGGAKVTRSVPPHTVVSGDPARIVRRLSS